MQACIVAKIKKKKIDLCLGLDCRAVQAPLAMTELGLGLYGACGLLKKLRLRLFWIATPCGARLASERICALPLESTSPLLAQCLASERVYPLGLSLHNFHIGFIEMLL